MLPKQAVANYLLGGLELAATGRWRNPAVLAGALDCYRYAVGTGLTHIPFFLVLDLYVMASFGNEFTFGDPDRAGGDGLSRQAYENRVLNRLLREQTFQEALEILNHARVDDDAEAQFQRPRVARLTTLVLQKLAPHWPNAVALNAAHLRGLTLRVPKGEPNDNAERDWRAQVSDAQTVPSQDALLSAFVESVTGVGAGTMPLKWADIVPAEDMFELEHLDVLEHEYLRIHIRQIIRVRESIAPLTASDIDLVEENAESESRFVDQSQYPTGGFSGLTTRGSFENLVLSELIYMDEAVADAEGAARAVDLFDVRFVEGELLYYTRDSGQLFRKRRSLHVVLDFRTSLAIKYPEHPYQLGTLLIGFVLAAIRDLTWLLSKDAVVFHVYVLGEAGAKEAAQALDTLELLLEHPIQHGRLSVEHRQELPLDAIASARRKSYLIGLSADAEVVNGWAKDVAAKRAAASSLFGAAVHLGGGAAVADGVFEMDPAQMSLGDLERQLVQAIMLE